MIMRKTILAAAIALSACDSSGVPAEGAADNAGSAAAAAENEQPSPEGRMWVTSQYLDRHTCPSTDCGIVGRMFFRDAADVLERRAGWARVTKVYDASCVDGRSEYVDKGNAACTEANGIVNGQFAEWVLASKLSAERPPDPAETASASERLVADSDDFAQYRSAFTKAATTLIQEGRCTAADFEEQGGWTKSSNHRDEPIYFTYCGEMTIANRIYLNAESGRIFQ